MAARAPSQKLVVFAVLFGLLASACGSPATETEAAAPAEATESEAAGVNQLSGEFDTIAGDSIDLSTLQGSDVVLWFWAPW